MTLYTAVGSKNIFFLKTAGMQTWNSYSSVISLVKREIKITAYENGNVKKCQFTR